MAKRTTSTDKVILDPIFPIPEGAEETFEYEKEQDDVEVVTDESSEFLSGDNGGLDSGLDYYFEEEVYFDDGFTEDSQYFLSTPTEFYVTVPQILRRAPGGQQVVDIVLEIEDIEGATNYEIQVTKI